MLLNWSHRIGALEAHQGFFPPIREVIARVVHPARPMALNPAPQPHPEVPSTIRTSGAWIAVVPHIRGPPLPSR